MTSVAADRRVDVPVADKFFTELTLAGAGGRLPIHVGDLVERAEMIFRGAVALETPAHALGLVMPDDLHAVDVAVAGDAADAAIHVGGVVEINVVRRLVDADPGNGLAVFQAVRTGSNFGLRALIWVWQFMQVWVVGTLEWEDFSTWAW